MSTQNKNQRNRNRNRNNQKSNSTANQKVEEKSREIMTSLISIKLFKENNNTSCKVDCEIQNTNDLALMIAELETLKTRLINQKIKDDNKSNNHPNKVHEDFIDFLNNLRS